MMTSVKNCTKLSAALRLHVGFLCVALFASSVTQRIKILNVVLYDFLKSH